MIERTSNPDPRPPAARIELPPGLYRYHCNIHSSMEGFVEVLPEEQTPLNPTHEQIDAEIARDHDSAQAVFEELCQVVEEAIALYHKDGKPLPPATSGRDL